MDDTATRNPHPTPLVAPTSGGDRRKRAREVARAIKLSVLAVVAAVLVILGSQSPDVTRAGSEVYEPSIQAPAQAERLVERHDCWMGEAPADVDYPGGVVVERADGSAVFSGRPAMVDEALRSVFDGLEVGYSVVAFCRGERS